MDRSVCMYQPVGGKVFTKPFWAILSIIFLSGVFFLIRFIFGLGAVTNLNDGYPWGVWIIWDVLIGTGLGCGGFSLAFLVYILNNWKYSCLLRPAILTGMFGYTFAGIAVIVDVGRYFHMYHVLLPPYWQFNSVLFEVAVCIIAYTVVQWIEFTPVFLERWEAKGIIKNVGEKLNKLLFILISLGILLPIMHQSSLGSLLIIAGQKIHPLWQSPLFPLYFLVSCIIMGFAAVVLETIMASYAFKRPIEIDLLASLAYRISWLTGLYLFLRFEDLIFRGQLGLAFKGDFLGNMFILENLLYLLPLIIMMFLKYRHNPGWQFISAVLFVSAAALYRFNTYWIAYNRGSGWQYFPSIREIILVTGIIAIEVAAYFVFVKKLPVLPVERRT